MISFLDWRRLGGFRRQGRLHATDIPDFAFHVEICEDFWSPQPPSTMGALAGANILLNLSASNIVIGKAEDRAVLCDSQSRRATAAYVFAAAPARRKHHGCRLGWPSHRLRDGREDRRRRTLRARAKTRHRRHRCRPVSRKNAAASAPSTTPQARVNELRSASGAHSASISAHQVEELPLQAQIDRLPFVPDDLSKRDRDCFEAYNIQVSGLAKRIETTNTKRVVIGVSGGLDSTHALIVIARAFDLLGLPRKNIIGVTMPGFATSEAHQGECLGADECARHRRARGLHRAAGAAHARGSRSPCSARRRCTMSPTKTCRQGLRTDYLFRLANKEGGFVVGTGDLSELALGWCTYGVGDHMSHYNVNGGAPKTLIQYLIRWVAESKLFDANTSATLLNEVLDR
jgi:NAD+ synthase (glutamine-hydrolysing)